MKPLTGKRVALAEGRQLEELAQMLEQEGADIVRCPLLSMVDTPAVDEVHAWLSALAEGQFSLVVFLTGEGVRRLLSFADRAGTLDRVLHALGQVPLVTRGPKPGQALKEVGVTPKHVAKKPTTEGVIETLMTLPLANTLVGVQLYSESNPPLLAALTQAQARVHTVLPYHYASQADEQRVCALLEQMSRGELACVVFTSSPQVDRLMEVVKEKQLHSVLAAGVAQTRFAAVGPIVAESLKRAGLPVHICPEQGFVMKNLVLQIKRAFAAGS